VSVGRGHRHGQRQAARVGEHVQLGAGLATVDRVRPGQRAPYLWRDPRSTGSVHRGFSVGLKRCRSAAAVKVERPWTNDLDRGEDRPILSAAEEDEGQVSSGAAPDSVWWPQE
jgi:hypothetical protein